MEEGEPTQLAKIRTLTGRLEEQPLKLGVLFVHVRDGDLVLGVVLVDEIYQNGIGLPVLSCEPQSVIM